MIGMECWKRKNVKRTTWFGSYQFNEKGSIHNKTLVHCAALTRVMKVESTISIGNYTFSSCTSLTSITIPKSVKTIGKYAFYGCTSLTTLTMDYDNWNYW